MSVFTVLAFPAISLLSRILVLTFLSSVPGVQFPQLINICRTDVSRKGRTQADEGNPGNFATAAHGRFQFPWSVVVLLPGTVSLVPRKFQLHHFTLSSQLPFVAKHPTSKFVRQSDKQHALAVTVMVSTQSPSRATRGGLALQTGPG